MVIQIQMFRQWMRKLLRPNALVRAQVTENTVRYSGVKDPAVVFSPASC